MLGKHYFNHSLKQQLDKVARLRKEYHQAVKAKKSKLDVLLKKWKTAHKKAKKAVRAHQKKQQVKEVERVTSLLKTHEMRAFHRWEQEKTHGPRVINAITPVMGKDSNLITDPKGILKETYQYYKDLNQDDPHNRSQDQEY